MAGTAKTRSQLLTQLNAAIFDNNNREIEASVVNQLLQDVIASAYNSLDDGAVTVPRADEITLSVGANTITFSSSFISTDFQIFINAKTDDISFGVPYDITVAGFKINSDTGGDISYLAILNN